MKIMNFKYLKILLPILTMLFIMTYITWLTKKKYMSKLSKNLRQPESIVNDINIEYII